MDAGSGRTSHYAGTTRQVNGKPVWTGKIGIAPDATLTQPLRWKRPRRIFVNSMSDLFHEAVPNVVIARVFAVMALSPQHTFQVLTKRPERMREYLSNPASIEAVYDWVCDMSADQIARVSLIAHPDHAAFAPPGRQVRLGAWPLPNVWLGVSIEDQRRADERVPILLDTPAAVRWVSAEPLLGPIDLLHLDLLTALRIKPDAEGLMPRHSFDALRGHSDIHPIHGAEPGWAKLDWVVAGGESGPGARPMHPDWARSLRDQCSAAGVPFLFKQWGSWHPNEFGGRAVSVCGRNMINVEPDGCNGHGAVRIMRVTKKAAGRLLDGVEHDAHPEPRA